MTTTDHSHLRLLCTAVALALLTGCSGGGGSDGGEIASTAQLAAALPDGNHVGIGSLTATVDENARRLRVPVLRTGAANNSASVRWHLESGSATAGLDFLATEGTLQWDAGDIGERFVDVVVLSDLESEGTETLTLRLSDLAGDERLENSAITIHIDDSTCSAELPATISADTELSEPCYRLTRDLSVSGTAQLSLAAGTQIIADQGTRLTLTEQAVLDASGTASLPVVLTGDVPGQAGRWQGISLDGDSPLHRLTHTLISGATTAVNIGADARLAAFENNHIPDSAGFALSLPVHAAEQLGSGNQWPSGHAIELRYRRIATSESVTIPFVDTHYVSSQSLIVEGALAIDAGVAVHFAEGTRLYVSNAGSLSTSGTLEAPVVLRGVTPEAGAWDGVQWISSSSANNRLIHTEVRHAGGDPTRPGNLIVEGAGSTLTLESVTLADSAGYGLLQLADVANITTLSVVFENNALGDRSE